MANLIGFSLDSKSETREVLSRSSLLSELVSKDVLSCATQEVKDIFNLLEHEFSPLDLAAKVQPLLSKVSKLGGKLASASPIPEVHLSQYAPSLEKLATLRLIHQVSQVYQTMNIESLSRMIPFFEFPVVEKIAVDAVKHNFVALKVDHMKNLIMFGNLGFESKCLQDYLTVLAESLNKAWTMIQTPTSRSPKLEGILPGLREVVDKEHKRLLARKLIIEKRKEEEENQLVQKEKEAVLKRQIEQKKMEDAEKQRQFAEADMRQRQRILEEIRQRELAEAQELLNADKCGGKKKGRKKTADDDKMWTKKDIMERALTEQLRDRQEMEKKLQKLAKTMDYLERAKREEAAPLIEAAFQQRLVEEQSLHELEQQQEVDVSRERHDGDLREKNRMTRMLDNKNIFQAKVMHRKKSEFDRQRADREERIAQIVGARKPDRETKRKLIFIVRMEEERTNKLREEEEARKREEAERRKKEEAERKAKLDEIAEKQRQRERELEEKERLRREALLRSADGPLAQPLEIFSAMRAEPLAANAAPAAAAAAAAPAMGGKYVPKVQTGRTNWAASSLEAASL